MSITPTEGVRYGVSTNTGSTASTNGFGDQQVFLELMVAQMRYQDPLNPTDSSQFMAQTAQFTALEKMQAVADQTAMLLSTQLAFGASSLIGQTVRWYDETGAEQSGTVQGTTYLSTGPVLSVDGTEVPITDVISVGTAPTIKAPTPSGGTTYVPPSGTPSTTTA
ncbi:flagellar hook assembly protein FlgD [Nocardioides humi]|uniref:Flagellar hook capping FlgD N-terminal domain-containing protein n=1 Tax=Nocardioides humi TaxID=449461 RepID=A0ABN2BHR3_9ACTN|nr:flagellar hook capping FlgD N-terminal domain-containing protein [Nocardioides humi]